MSYDLMVFAPEKAPQEREAFTQWYTQQIEWGETHDYNDPQVTTAALQAWYQDMLKCYPSMSDPALADANLEGIDADRLTEYRIGKDAIYISFALTVVEEAARQQVRELAVTHGVGFFDVSSENGEILFP